MRGYLGLGSNVGDRRANLQAAIDALPDDGVIVLASSSTYDTDPVGEILDQPAFLNACVRIETALGPSSCSTPARRSSASWGATWRTLSATRPRPIDVDLLLLGDEPYESERLDACPTPRPRSGASCSSRCSSSTSTSRPPTGRG